MGRDDVARAVQAMSQDEDVAERLAGGDFTDLADADLTDAERAMVIAAADDIPDVAGFGVFAKIGDIEGESLRSAVFPKVEVNLKSPFGVATTYGYSGDKF